MSHRRVHVFCVLAFSATLAACGSKSSSSSEATRSDAAKAVATVPIAAETPVTAGAQLNDVAFWLNAADPSRSVVIGASGDAGLEIFGVDGKRIGVHAGLRASYVAVTRELSLGGSRQPVVVAYDEGAGALVAFRFDPASQVLAPVSARPLQVGSEVTGLCTFRSPRTGRNYVFAATDDGHLQHWELFTKGDQVDGGVVRTLPIGVGAGYCAVDDLGSSVYVTEETTGIWKLPAEPETDAARELVDTLGPRGQLGEEVKGIALYPLDAKRAFLLAADVAAGRINVYSTGNSKYLGSFSLPAAKETPALQEAEGLAVTSAKLGGGALGDGAVAIVDQGSDAAAANVRFVAWSAIASALKLEGSSPQSAGGTPVTVSANVMPSVETEPVDDYGDAADDPAIWVHPRDPARSLIVGAQKKRGLYVYDLAGKTLQVLADGRMNNVDLRQGVKLGGGASIDIVAASNRTTRTLALYAVNASTRRLADVAAAPIPTGFDDPYGLCMYRSARTGDTYVFMNDADSGAYKQWRLVAKGDKVAAEVVREFTVGSQAEGCAADDEAGALYIAEEDVGLWRYEAEPSGADRRVPLDDTTEKGNLTADVEGVAIYYGKDGAGYVVVSNQGDNNYAVYRRDGKNEFLGHFSVVADPARGIDGASETDGLDVISTALGPAFPHGLFIAQDGRNIAPMERQNFKLVPWERVADAMGLQ
jgi:3-phytase